LTPKKKTHTEGKKEPPFVDISEKLWEDWDRKRWPKGHISWEANRRIKDAEEHTETKEKEKITAPPILTR